MAFPLRLHRAKRWRHPLPIIGTVARGLAGCALIAIMSGAWAYGDDASETIRPLLQENLQYLPGNTFTSAIVDFGPGVRAAPHTHGKAFVYAYVLAR
ncbi:hypothetical protein SNE35_31315 [Paucibacter sp. R3-3]|uniref:Cupin domain-containing protein n=1 Tax=Roseateles agri TaxID=3098619 RepID=A0ABU5DT09_9BURK|nr:hypothetical protein [Paucibacter sp. R3-3]MDY0749028.1 hypothetical protein [Paucibacter sp. R3-3]